MSATNARSTTTAPSSSSPARSSPCAGFETASRLLYGINYDSHGWDVHLRNDSSQLVEEDLSSHQRRTLTSEPICHLQPTYAADGRSIYLDRTDCGASWQIAVLVPGGEESPLRLQGRAREPAPSPDGKHLAYLEVTAGALRIMVANADGSAATEVARTAQGETLGLQWVSEGAGLAWRAAGTISIVRLSDRRLEPVTGGGVL